MNKKIITLFIFTIFISTFLSAFTTDLSIGNLSNSQFKEFLKEFVSIAGFKDNRPAETLGLLGFEVGAGYEFYNTGRDKNRDTVFNQDTGSNENGMFIHIRKGLLFNLDAGLRYVNLVNTNTYFHSFELRYGIQKGSMLMPAIALTANYTVINGFTDMKGNILGANLSISKGVGPITPYGGVGIQAITGEPYRNTSLKKQKENVFTTFVGCRFSFTPVNYINLQATHDENISYSISANFGF